MATYPRLVNPKNHRMDFLPKNIIFPSSVVYYNCALIAAWLTLCLFIINCCIREFAGKVELFAGILKLSWLRLLLGMDVSSVSTCKIEVFDPCYHRHISIFQSFEYKDLQIEPSPNDDLRKLIDRIAFVLLVFVAGIFISVGY